jgi:hypothetical protein
MLSIGLWRRHINTTFTILDIIQRPVFYLKLNSIKLVCPYLAGNALRLLCEPNRLMLSTGLWQWHINITITILNIIHRPVFYLNHKVSGTRFCLRLQEESNQVGTYSDGDRIQSRNYRVLNTRLGGPQCRSWQYGEMETFYPTGTRVYALANYLHFAWTTPGI